MSLQAWTTRLPPHTPRSVHGIEDGSRLTRDLWHHRVLTWTERRVRIDDLDAGLDRLLDGRDEADAVERQDDEPLVLLLGDRVLHRVVLLRRVEARVDLRQLDVRVALQHAGDSVELALNVRVGERREVGDVDRRLPGSRRGQRDRQRNCRGRGGDGERDGYPPTAPLGHVAPFLGGLQDAGLRRGGLTPRAHPPTDAPLLRTGLRARKPPVAATRRGRASHMSPGGVKGLRPKRATT